MRCLYDSVTFLLNMLTFYIQFKGADIFFKSKKNKKLNGGVSGFIFCIVFARMYVGYKKIQVLDVIVVFLPYVVLLGYLLLGYIGKVAGKVAYVLVSSVALTLIEMVPMFLLISVFNISMERAQQRDMINMISLIISILVYAIALAVLKKVNMTSWKINTEILKLIAIMAGINEIMVVVVYALSTQIKVITRDSLFLLMSAVLLCMTILNVVVFRTMSKVARKNYETLLELQYMRAQEQQNRNMEAVTQNLRQLRHDMNNHMGMLYGLCDTGQYESMRKYLQQMMESTSQANDIIVVQNNQALSIVLNNKRTLAEKYSIPFTYGVKKTASSEKMRTIPMTELEICSLFGNILDNAIEACKKMPKTAEACIKLLIQETENGWQILCKNTYSQKPVFEGEEPVSQKKDAQNHGIGTKAMRSIIKKYKGNLEYEVTDKEFGVKIFIAG